MIELILVRKLISEASDANKALLRRVLLPEKTEVIELPPGELGTGPGSRIINP